MRSLVLQSRERGLLLEIHGLWHGSDRLQGTPEGGATFYEWHNARTFRFKVRNRVPPLGDLLMLRM